METMLHLQARLCYATGLVTLAFALWSFVRGLAEGAAVHHERASVLVLLSVGALILGWVVEVTVTRDGSDRASSRLDDR